MRGGDNEFASRSVDCHGISRWTNTVPWRKAGAEDESLEVISEQVKADATRTDMKRSS